MTFFATAAAEVGLWRSEELLIRETFPTKAVLLDVGCGAGRVSLALWELGYQQVLGVDFARPMIKAARLLAAKLEYATPFRVAEVTRLGFDSEAFDGVLWTAAGLADLADPADRARALASLRHVTKPRGNAVITTPNEPSWPEADVRALFESGGWTVCRRAVRSALASEPEEVVRRYPDVVFWILQKEGQPAPG